MTVVSWGWCDQAIEALSLPAKDLNARAILRIEALTPICIASAQRGAYYQTSDRPDDMTLYGLLENLIGFHVDGKARGALFERTGAKMGRGTRFQTLLARHVYFPSMFVPTSVRFADVTVQMASVDKEQHVKGARDYDARLRPFMQDLVEEKVSLVDGRGEGVVCDPQEVLDYVQGTGGRFHVKDALRPLLPRYFIQAPIKREYLIPSEAWRVAVVTTEALASVLEQAVADPASAPYLGTSDSWVEVTWTRA